MGKWHDKAAAVQADGRAFIGGERVWAKSGQQFENLSPIDGRSLGMVARLRMAAGLENRRHSASGCSSSLRT
jgi:acyl-CoA reductase-like NAD-dependent aldehyde dehydrogenase